jgi:uncharacterized protein (TIGR00266 family)
MRYEIKGDNLPVVVCTIDAGESMITQGGAMAWMDPGIEMKTEGGGSIGKALGRMFSGEKIFRNIYTATRNDSMIAFSSSFPGYIVAYEITPDKPVIIQKSSFLATTAGLQTEVFFNKKIGAGLFGGEGFIMQKVSGTGTLFAEIDGSAIEYDLTSGQKIIVNTGSLATMDASCSMDIETVKGVKNIIFGGEGLFHTVITGPGHVTLQTMPVQKFVSAITPFLPTSSSGS